MSWNEIDSNGVGLRTVQTSAKSLESRVWIPDSCLLPPGTNPCCSFRKETPERRDNDDDGVQISKKTRNPTGWVIEETFCYPG